MSQCKTKVAPILNDLKDQVRQNRFVDIGPGAEHYYGISRMEFLTAVDMLKDETYVVFRRRMTQKGTKKVMEIAFLAAPGTDDREFVHRLAQLRRRKG